MRVLVTGATGLVGFETVETLRRAELTDVVGVSRPRSAADGHAIAWDIAAEPPPADLRRRWDVIVHAAADTRWTMAPDEALRANVDTVRALEPLVGTDTHVVHISTAFSVGLRGTADSATLADYRNSYEWSKAHAERLVRETFAQTTIIRPPLVIGRRSDGRAARFAGLYTVLRAITASMMPVVVAEADAYFEVVPVDALAELIAAVAQRPGNGEVLTLAGGPQALRVETVFELMTSTLNEWREAHDLEPFDAPRLVSLDSWNRFFLPFVREELSPRQQRILKLLSNFEPYLAITEPLVATHQVSDLEPCVVTAVRYWAETEPRQASMAPRPWTTAAAR